MRQLWQKTAALFWGHPILWVPTLVCDFIGFVLWKAQRLVNHQIVIWFSARGPHSVLAPAMSIPRSGPEALRFQLEASLLSAPLAWGANYVKLCLCVLAFLATVSLVRQILRGSSLDLVSTLTYEKNHPSRTLKLGGRILAINIVGGGPLFLLSPFVLPMSLYQNRVASFAYGALLECIALLLVAWFLSDAALQLIGAAKLELESLKRARMFAMWTAVAAAACDFCVTQMPVYSPSSWVYLLAQTAIFTIAGLVYVPLFIAFPLILESNTQVDSSSEEIVMAQQLSD